MIEEDRPSVYEAAGAEPGMLALAHAWHRQCLADPVAEHPFSHPGQHPQHVERLAAQWGEMLGGPATYTGELGSDAHMVRLHSGNGPHPELDAACQECFARALTEIGITADPLRQTMIDWFAWSTELVNHSYSDPSLVPDDLRLPTWSWDGPQATQSG
jgi:hemoglobin